MNIPVYPTYSAHCIHCGEKTGIGRPQPYICSTCYMYVPPEMFSPFTMEAFMGYTKQ